MLRLPPHTRTLGVAIAVAVALAGGALAVFHEFTVDDAFIAYRHARNAARGDGLVMNPGERVEGVSNAPWTLGLGLAARLGVAPDRAGPWASRGACLLAVLATACFGAAAVRRGGVAAWAAASFLPLAIWGASGMETAACAACVAGVAAALTAARPRLVWASIGLVLLVLLRPEGIALAVAATVAWGMASHRRRAAIGILVVVVAVWALAAGARFVYYGDWLPNPVRAKSPSWGSIVPGLIYAGRFAAAYPLAVWALSRRALPPVPRALAIALLGAQTLFVIAAGGDHFAAMRFFVPVWPVLAVALAAAQASIPGGTSSLEKKGTTRSGTSRGTQQTFGVDSVRRWVAPALVIGGLAFATMPQLGFPLAAPIAAGARLQLPVEAHRGRIEAEVRHLGVVALAAGLFFLWIRRRNGAEMSQPTRRHATAVALLAAVALPQAWDPQLRQCLVADGASRYGRITGTWLGQHLPPNAVVATNAVGALPYYADRPVLDMLGLTDREIAHRRRSSGGWVGHERGDGRVVLDRKPHVLVLAGAEGSRLAGPFIGDREIVADPRFGSEYVEESVVLTPSTGPRFEFVYYRRRDCAACGAFTPDGDTR